jgi:hypothetical protein
MKIRILVIDPELSLRAKRLLAAAAIPALLLGGAVAYASVPKTWTAGEALKAAELNGNFSDLDSRVTAIEQKAPKHLVATSEVSESSAMSADLVYQSMALDLTPGTWLVQASATVTTTVNADGVQISLWDDTNGAELPMSRSPVATTMGFVDNVTCNQGCSAIAATTLRVVTVTANTKVRLKAHRNGGSKVWVGTPTPGALPRAHRLTAVQLD